MNIYLLLIINLFMLTYLFIILFPFYIIQHILSRFDILLQAEKDKYISYMYITLNNLYIIYINRQLYLCI